MSVALIQETAKEVRRLAIAGSPLSVGDFRLKKLMGPLEQAGAKVPVFAQVSKAIGTVVEGTEADSAGNLLNLSILLNAILYTQGQSGADGQYSELESLATNCSHTRTSLRILKPLIQALTSTGSGRFEIVKSAFESGAFNDLRLVEPSIQALGDSFGELADLVAHKILPTFGPGIVPRLKVGFDIKGKRLDARKLALMFELDPANTLELCKAALEDGSVEVKEVAIHCLGKVEDCLPLVLDQVKSKNKTLRAAALQVLAHQDRPEVTKVFSELIKGKSLDGFTEAFLKVKSREVRNLLLAEGRRVFDEIIKGNEGLLQRYSEILVCIDFRGEPEEETFLLSCYESCGVLMKMRRVTNSNVGGEDVVLGLARLLYQIGTPKMLEALLVQREVLPTSAFEWVFGSALRVWPASRVYEEFAPLLQNKKGAGKAKVEAVETVLWNIMRSVNDTEVDWLSLTLVNLESADAKAFQSVHWDDRWLDTAVECQSDSVVCALARPGHQKAITYLLSMLEPKKTKKSELHLSWFLSALARCKYESVADVFMSIVLAKSKEPKIPLYEFTSVARNVEALSATDLPKLEAFAKQLDEKFVDTYLEALEPLRLAAAKV